MPKQNGLSQQPYCFIADTDSVSYVMDTGANRIIVNDVKHLKGLIPSNDKVKGIGGSCVRIAGSGKLSLPLKSDDGKTTIIRKLNAVYVPTSPFNLIPPQILIKEMKRQRFQVHYFKHDDKHYIFKYTPLSKNKLESERTLTISIGDNNLFTLRTREGYKNFMSRASE